MRGGSVLYLEEISKSFEGLKVIDNVSFQIDAGERVSVVGPGGCGKSTAWKILLGVMEPDEGEANILGTDMVNSPVDEKLATLKKVGMSFQQGALFDYMTVEENLKFAMRNMTDFDEEKMDQVVEDLLAGVKLSRTRDMFPYELSGGMQRRIGIARALATDPEVAIFDEPTSGLDPVTSTIVLNMIEELGSSRSNNSLVITTTAVEMAIRFSDRIIVFNDKGQIAADGHWRELLVSGPEWVKNFLGVRLIGLDIEYTKVLDLPKEFVDLHWS